jgi:tRNA G10  N-methylase Trm11
MMFNFLNLFQERETKKILDPFVGNGTILMFALLQDFQIYGADFDQAKINNTIRNIIWLLKELEEPIPLRSLFEERIKNIDIGDLSKYFEPNFFDGVCTEPSLGPFYREKPYYIQAKDIIDTELEPVYVLIFREIYKVLKPKGRICITAPIIETIDGGDVQLNVNKIAISNKFQPINLIDSKRIINKSNFKLQFQKQDLKNLIDAKKGQILKRKIYVYEKQN